MATHGRGLICLALPAARIEALGLPLMSPKNSSRHETAFTLSIEAREGVTTGISAADRARTVSVAIDPARGAADIATPGHVFPLRARDGGVLVRAGHTEAAVDVSRLAGLNPSGVICEIMNDDGTMARLPDLISFRPEPRAEDRHHQRPDRLSPPPRQSDQRKGRAADHLGAWRRLADADLFRRNPRRRSCRADQGRSDRHRAGSGAGACAESAGRRAGHRRRAASCPPPCA